jgi:hypothetical protein
MNILLLLLALYYFVRACGHTGTGYRDILGIAFALALSSHVIIALAIAIEDFGGIDTYFTDPSHGGSLNPVVHMVAHVTAAAVLETLILWGLGSLLLTIAGRKPLAGAG